MERSEKDSVGGTVGVKTDIGLLVSYSLASTIHSIPLHKEGQGCDVMYKTRAAVIVRR